MLLRVGIDKGCGGALSPIFKDGSFEYIPIPELDHDTRETRTYQNTSEEKIECLPIFYQENSVMIRCILTLNLKPSLMEILPLSGNLCLN